MSALEDWYPEPDPENVLSLEEVARIAAEVDLSDMPSPRGLEDENGEYVHVNGNPRSLSKPLESQRCEYRSDNTGRRCKKFAAVGLRHCDFHNQFGEATAVLQDFVIDYARRDLYRLTPMALGVIEDIMTDEDVNPAVRLKAATETLDRVGVRGGAELQVNVETTIHDPAAEIRARLERLSLIAASAETDPEAAARVRAIAAGGKTDEIVDAEIIEG